MAHPSDTPHLAGVNDSSAASARSVFWSELKRRHVLRATLAYLVASFVAIEAADVLVPALELPGWVVQLVTVLAIAGFPVAVGLAWAFDRTPGGLVRTAPLASRPSQTGGPAADAVRDAQPSPDGAASMSPVAPAFDRRAIAVLPFANMSDLPENEFFSDGVTEDILANLSKTGRLRVTSRTSVMVYKGTTKPVREIARELGVGTVLEGSVRRAGQRVRVVAQLIDAGTDEHLWAETYDRDLEDIFAVQSDVALSIARALATELAPEVVTRIRARPTKSMEAYDLYLRARQYEDVLLPEARTLLERAIELDPDFAAAHAQLAMTLMIGVYYAHLEPDAVFGPAGRAVKRALALGPDLGDAHAARAWLAFHYDWEWAEANRSVDRALELDPNQTEAMFVRAALLVTRERFEEGIDALNKVLVVDPHQAVAQSHRAQYTVYAGRLEEAEQMARAVTQRYPDFYHGHFALAYALVEQGRDDDAIPVLKRLTELVPDVPLWRYQLASSLQRTGFVAEADRMFAEIVREAERTYVDPVVLSFVAVQQGDVEKALDWLEEGLRRRAFLMLWIRAIPRCRPLRSHPRFQAILRAIWPEDEIEGVPQ